MRSWCRTLFLLALCEPAAAADRDMLFIAPMSAAMPMAEFADGKLSNGIIKDVSEAIAHKLGRTPKFASIPGKRVEYTLAAGEADGVCNVLPGWIKGDFHWSRPLIPNAGIIISHRDAPVVRALADLKGKRVGTVLGYRYPGLEGVIDTVFLREDARTVQQVFMKMGAGRNAHAIAERLEFEYEVRTNKALKLREDLVFETYKTSCAFSKLSKVPFAEIEQAIAALNASGAIDAIVARYR